MRTLTLSECTPRMQYSLPHGNYGSEEKQYLNYQLKLPMKWCPDSKMRRLT